MIFFNKIFSVMRLGVMAVMLAPMLMAACSDSKDFSIAGHVEGLGSQSVTLTYFASGGIKSETVMAVDGHFRIHGETPQPSLGIVSVAPDNDRLAVLVIENGNEITIDGSLADPYSIKVKGNSDAEATAEWVAANAEALRRGDAETINASIAEYVRANRTRRSSTALLTTWFQSDGFETMADSLFSILAPEVRRPEMVQGFNNVLSSYLAWQEAGPLNSLSLYESCDSIVHINPMRHSATMLCFVDPDASQRDSIACELRRLTRLYPLRRLMAVEISMAADSASWRRSIGTDTVGWARTWTPGSTGASSIRRMGVGRIPFFIVADSTGRVLHRGPSVKSAAATVENVMKNRIDTTSVLRKSKQYPSQNSR